MFKILPPLVFRAPPITVAEFMDAVAETCPPIVGSLYRTPYPRDVALAISGGVDSMALALLCAKSKHRVHLKVGDHRVRYFRPIVVDHGLREGSREEVTVTTTRLKKIGLLTPLCQTIRWHDYLKDIDVDHPSKLPGLETLARKLRYRIMAKACLHLQMNSILVAHHEDDQYETVLMRLLGRHGPKGLQGMRPAVNIPECRDIHRAYRSGLIDQQQPLSRSPNKQLYIMAPTKRELSAMRSHLNYVNDEAYERDMREGNTTAWERFQELVPNVVREGRIHARDTDRTVSSHTPHLHPIDIEDGGIRIYRPLLHFPKERLVSTCLVDGVEWSEDETNKDPTFTTRNAIRITARKHVMPKALQKPAVLALAQRCRAKVKAEEDEATRLLYRAILGNFQPNVGTVVVQFPRYGIENIPPRDRRCASRREHRIRQRRSVASVSLRKVFSLVSPMHKEDLSVINAFTDIFFPGLRLPGDPQRPSPPKAIAVCNVHCAPIPCSGHSRVEDLSPTQWYLSRAPFPADKKPSITIGTSRYTVWNQKFRLFRDFKQFDGRFWILVLHRFPTRVFIEPFSPEHSKPFRETLAPEDRKKLDGLLKKYAPGKTRFTLPGIYLSAHSGGVFLHRELMAWGKFIREVRPKNIDYFQDRQVKFDYDYHDEEQQLKLKRKELEKEQRGSCDGIKEAGYDDDSYHDMEYDDEGDSTSSLRSRRLPPAPKTKVTVVHNVFTRRYSEGKEDSDDSGDKDGRLGPEKLRNLAAQRTLVALPTLGIHSRGLKKHLMKYETRYKNVDQVMLNNSDIGGSSEAWARWRNPEDSRDGIAAAAAAASRRKGGKGKRDKRAEWKGMIGRKFLRWSSVSREERRLAWEGDRRMRDRRSEYDGVYEGRWDT